MMKIPYLEIAKVVLIHCNVANISYQQNSRVLHTFIPNKLFGNSRHFSEMHYMFENIWFRFSYVKLWFTYKNSNPLEIRR